MNIDKSKYSETESGKYTQCVLNGVVRCPEEECNMTIGVGLEIINHNYTDADHRAHLTDIEDKISQNKSQINYNETKAWHKAHANKC